MLRQVGLAGAAGAELVDGRAQQTQGALEAYRDATLFKVVYGWGLRRTETSKLDLTDCPDFRRWWAQIA